MEMRYLNKEAIFGLTIAGRIGGDCTAPYDVTLCKELTLVEFIEAVVKGVDGYGRSEWGCISIDDGSKYYNAPSCHYKHGEIEAENIPEEMLSRKVKSVSASGGWSNMDYRVQLEECGSNRYKERLTSKLSDGRIVIIGKTSDIATKLAYLEDLIDKGELIFKGETK